MRLPEKELHDLLTRGASLLQSDDQHAQKHFTMRFPSGNKYKCRARLSLDWKELGFRVVVVDAASGVPLCTSLPGRAYNRDRGDDEALKYTIDARAQDEIDLAKSEAAYHKLPPHFVDLVDCAASRLKAEGWRQLVALTWFADGAAKAYTARINWASNELDPRIIVFNGRSGDFICQSLPGKLHVLDPYNWSSNVAPDAVAEYVHQQQQRAARRRAASAAAKAA